MNLGGDMDKKTVKKKKKESVPREFEEVTFPEQSGDVESNDPMGDSGEGGPVEENDDEEQDPASPIVPLPPRY